MAIAGFDWDSGNWPKCAKHGVSRDDIEAVLTGRFHVQPDRVDHAGEQRFNAIGKTPTGRFIFVVFTLRKLDGADFIRPISARYMHRKEIAHYERQQGL
ncbi:BrnT family toxin [Segnochrobactrum spirostomi]|uniref:BrnT family toxin n=1 Tax=Segnochrobactrum spirostomi TaxID=2608987 RepID=A0A6A7Y2J2_9HYPH|nr:BrnT family toxin [Segnochrobactrum spirostomi]MQT13290.1 BrnT family toxin [Segnochrobactrum spirostomi]